MSSISVVGNSEFELEHMIARVALPATTRLPDRSSGDRAPQTPEKPRRQARSAANLPQRKSEAREDEHADEATQPPEPPPAEEVQLYSPTRKAGASYSKDQGQHNVDIRA